MARREVPEIEKRYLFLGGFEGRDTDTTKDQRFVNLYQETVGQTKKLKKRPGAVSNAVESGGTALPTGVSRAYFYFNNKYWAIVGTKLYKNGAVDQDEQDYAAAQTLDTATGIVGHCPCSISGADGYFFCDGEDGYYINSSDTVTKISDADFPTPHVATPVFLDGYVFIAKGADIYNCALENPSSWVASNYITSEMFNDGVTALAVQNNMILSFGTKGTEFFYDAANVSGSPLARNTNNFLQIGCVSPHCIGVTEKKCIFISQSDSSGRAVWNLDGFSEEKVSTPQLDRLLNEETTMSTVSGYMARMDGHLFFFIFLSTRTFVYDFDEKVWHEWTSSNRETYTGTTYLGGEELNVTELGGGSAIFSAYTDAIFDYPFKADTEDGIVHLLHRSGQHTVYLDSTVYRDREGIIKCQVNTGRIDFETNKRKSLARVSVIGDLASNNLFLRYSDDDYQTWTDYISTSMESNPVFHALGQFRRRAFSIYYTDNYPLRLEGFEFLFTVGET